MGFYGNITNVNKSTFQFDRVYPNKATMEQFCSNDDVYIGRYVLVDYNLDTLNLDGPNQTPEDIVNGANVIIGYDLKVKGPNDVNEVSAIYDNGSPVLYTGARPNTPLIKGGESLGGNRVIAGSYVLIVGTIHKTISVTPGSDPSAYVVEYGPTITENDTYTSMLKPVLYCCTNIEDTEKPVFEEVSKTVAIDDVYRLNYQVDNDRYGAVGRG